MILKYTIFIVGLSTIMISCGGAPEPNSINCSPSGMEKVLPTFSSETERQAFIDKCKSPEKKN